ncbi:MAG: hypothetical protein J0M15_13085 [Deltaproteobacteria bacterium]|nr:hypothetical protein [Deltaproteobacteria bacterium]
MILHLLEASSALFGNLTLAAEKHGFPKSTVTSWISRQPPHHNEKHKQNSELKDMKEKVKEEL